MTILVILSCIGLLSFLWMRAEAYFTRIRFHTYSNESTQTNRSARILFVSDLHRRKISDAWLQKHFTNIDLCILGGDALEHGVAVEQLKHNIQALRAVAPVVYVWGNNEGEVGIDACRHAMQSVPDVIELSNESRIFSTKEGLVLQIIGMDDLNERRCDVDKAFEKVSDDMGIDVAVCHNPAVLQFVRDKQWNLLMSGHTHGGQIRLFGWGLYPKGKWSKFADGRVHLVSNGFGTTKLPLRLGAPAEIHHITILQ